MTWHPIATVDRGQRADLWGVTEENATPRRHVDCRYLPNLAGWYNRHGERVAATAWMVVEGPVS